MMRPIAIVAAVAAAIVAGTLSGGEQSSGAATAIEAPPPGLTAYGRNVWNLEALLRRTFGTRDAYFEYVNRRRGPVNFTPTFKGNAFTAYYIFTFAKPQASSFQLVSLDSPLPPAIGASGSQLAVTLNGRYVYCGSGRWLYYHSGNGPANFQLDCWKP